MITDAEIDELFTLKAQSKIHITEAEVPSVLWHYTSSHSLGAIINSKTFRSSRFLHMNDPREFEHGMDIFLERLNTEETGLSDELIDYLKELINSEKKTPSLDIYFSSFSSIKDDQYQWRNYGLNGSGVSIGVKPQRMLRSGTDATYWTKVLYSDEDKNKRIDEVFSLIKDTIDKLTNNRTTNPDIKTIRLFFLKIFQIIFQEAARMKHKDWCSENEYRLITVMEKGDLRIKMFVANNGDMRNYIEIDWIKNFSDIFDELMCGRLMNYHYFKTTLEVYKIQESAKLKISHSEVPSALLK